MNNDTHRPGTCHICRRDTQVRWKNIYHMGSEGLWTCGPCEQRILFFILALKGEHQQARKAEVLARKEVKGE